MQEQIILNSNTPGVGLGLAARSARWVFNIAALRAATSLAFPPLAAAGDGAVPYLA